jgi:2-octaprenyl-6-methoxyphenol hydroxylase
VDASVYWVPAFAGTTVFGTHIETALLGGYFYNMSATDSAAQEFDVAVVGGGPAGLTAAVAAAQSGVRTALVARRVPYGDNRTTALLHASIRILEDLDVWNACREQSAPLRVMRLVDDSGRLIRAPELSFACEEIGLDAFGYNIKNRNLVAALEHRASECPALVRIDDDAEAVETADANVLVRCRQGQTLRSRLVVGADGRHSLCRLAARIDIRRRDLAQSALTLNIEHARPHSGVSTEFHTANGPCVFVPLPGHRSSVVWVMRPEDAERRAGLTDEALAQDVEAQSHFHLGRMQIGPQRNVFPLAFEQATRIAANRIALVGEAAHVLPPIGAQGLNLGLRDAAEIATIAADALLLGQDPGADAALNDYARRRRLDVSSRSFVVDIANRSLLSDFLPVQLVRSIGMQALQQIGPLRRFVMRQAIAPRFIDAP